MIYLCLCYDPPFDLDRVYPTNDIFVFCREGQFCIDDQGLRGLFSIEVEDRFCSY